MAVEAKAGTDWQDDELDAIIADYFAMLDADLSGRPYVKAEHNRALMAKTGRTHGSVEFKYQNVSAVLDALGLPWISGYKPRKNFQDALFGAIERFLMLNPGLLDRTPMKVPEPVSVRTVFVNPPVLAASGQQMPDRLNRLLRKFDPVERDYRNRALGRAGESFVVDLERRLLQDADRSDLARKVRWVAAEDGDGAGYDVLSFDPQGRERLIEVKTTNGSARTPFYLSRNEREVAGGRPEDWRIYRVHLFAKQPRIFTISPPLERMLQLHPEIWRATF